MTFSFFLCIRRPINASSVNKTIQHCVRKSWPNFKRYGWTISDSINLNVPLLQNVLVLIQPRALQLHFVIKCILNAPCKRWRRNRRKQQTNTRSVCVCVWKGEKKQKDWIQESAAQYHLLYDSHFSYTKNLIRFISIFLFFLCVCVCVWMKNMNTIPCNQRHRCGYMNTIGCKPSHLLELSSAGNAIA